MKYMSPSLYHIHYMNIKELSELPFLFARLPFEKRNPILAERISTFVLRFLFINRKSHSLVM